LGVISYDATILFNSFTHIYLEFCLCFIYKIPWYSLLYVLNALLDVRFKKSKLEIIDRFDLWSIFCAELKLWRSKESDSSGIRKLTSIPFYKYMTRKLKRERAWRSQPSKTNLEFYQCWPLAILTWISWAREVHLMQT